MASFFPSTTAADFITAITGVLTDNLAPILAIFGFMVGLRLAMKWLSHSTRGRLG